MSDTIWTMETEKRVRGDERNRRRIRVEMPTNGRKESKKKGEKFEDTKYKGQEKEKEEKSDNMDSEKCSK